MLYDDQQYVDSYENLHEQKMGIQFFRAATRSKEKANELIKILKEDCKLPSGMALSLVEDFGMWYDQIKSTMLSKGIQLEA